MAQAPLYVKNPNYNPTDPRSNRYVTEPDAVTQSTEKSNGFNELFSPFTNLAQGMFKSYKPVDFYTPLPTGAMPNSTPPTSNFGPTTPPPGTPAPVMSGTATPNAAAVEATKAQGANAAIPATGAPATTPESVASHVVKAGDTLSQIAARFGTTVGALAQANGITDPNRIRVGQVINIGGTPIAGGSGTPVGGSPAAPGAAPIAIPQGPLTTAEIARLAKQAGEAGMSADSFVSLLSQNSKATGAQVEEIRTKLGIPNLVDETFKTPEKSTIQQYRELYDLSGLRDIQTKISEVDARINSKRADLVKATGELNNNPWVSQGTRQGRLKNLQELAFADINNDLEQKKQYEDVYDRGVTEIERQLGYITQDEETQDKLNVEKLNYLLNEAERQGGALEQDNITSGLRNIPEFLQGVLSRESTEQSRDMAKIAAQKATTSTGKKTSVTLRDILDAGGAPEAIVQASAGGKATTDTFRTSYEKTLNTLYQLNDLSKAFEAYKENTGNNGFFSGAEGEITGPILGIIRSGNPYDTKAQQIKAQLQAIVPNLARGVYGEVGVLTDQDIANYSQTLPNLKSTKEVRDALLAISAKSVYRALENKLLVQAKGGVDVSGYGTDLTTMRRNVDSLLQTAGVPVGETSGAGVDYSEADADYVNSLSL